MRGGERWGSRRRERCASTEVVISALDGVAVGGDPRERALTEIALGG